jgi:hypothetical protein
MGATENEASRRLGPPGDMADHSEGVLRLALEMDRVGEHFVPSGPLAVRWLAYEIGEMRAGSSTVVRLQLENAGSASWRSNGHKGIQLSYHWLDPLGNPIVWDGMRTSFAKIVQPGETVELDVPVRAPRPPGSYRLAFDLVEEHRFWLQELGSTPLVLAVDVRPRIDERRLRVVVQGGEDPETEAALSMQEDSVVAEDAVAIAYLTAGAVPAPDWSRLLLNAHAEGWPAVGGAVEVMGGISSRGDRSRLAPWAPGGGRNPRFSYPLLFPSLLDGIEPETHEGLPAISVADSLFEGRAVVRLRPRSGRLSG